MKVPCFLKELRNRPYLILVSISIYQPFNNIFVWKLMLRSFPCYIFYFKKFRTTKSLSMWFSNNTKQAFYQTINILTNIDVHSGRWFIRSGIADEQNLQVIVEQKPAVSSLVFHGLDHIVIPLLDVDHADLSSTSSSATVTVSSQLTHLNKTYSCIVTHSTPPAGPVSHSHYILIPKQVHVGLYKRSCSQQKCWVVY